VFQASVVNQAGQKAFVEVCSMHKKIMRFLGRRFLSGLLYFYRPVEKFHRKEVNRRAEESGSGFFKENRPNFRPPSTTGKCRRSMDEVVLHDNRPNLQPLDLKTMRRRKASRILSGYNRRDLERELKPKGKSYARSNHPHSMLRRRFDGKNQCIRRY
jgi:hypothetical protein